MKAHLVPATLALISAASTTIAGPGEPCGVFESPTPGQGQAGRMLSAIAVRADTGFAIGRSYPQGSGPFTPLLYRYDGVSWFEESLPPLPSQAYDPVLMSVAMSSAVPDTAWIVGYVSVPPTTNNLPLIARWRNGSFDRIDTPMLRRQVEYPYGPRGGFAYDAVVLADDDVWAVGQAGGFGDAVTSSVAMALHWNGSDWTDVPTPIVANRTHRFDAVSASAPDNVWAVGTSRNIGGPFLGFIQRWDGSSWNVVSHPALSIPASQFHDVLALSPSEVWVAGSINYTDPLLYRFNGSSWQSMPLPGGNTIVALDGSAPDKIWAVSAGAMVSIFFWNGSSWTEVSNPPPPGLIDSGRAISAASECDVWVAGSQMDSTGFFGTFIEHLAGDSAPCSADWNADGSLNSQDFFAFITPFFAQAQEADFDGNGSVNSQDFFEFLAAFFAGC